MKNEKLKEFFGTSWAINNKTSIYVLAVIIAIFGMMSYQSIPKEQFPELVIPTVIVNTIYPGTSPTDMENLITRIIEKNLKSINGVKKITSNSIQDFSTIIIEFNTGITVSDAKQKVKDAVDKSKSDLPNDMPADPNVMEIDFSEIPIMYINISGDFELDKLKRYADDMQDEIEALKEITRVDIVGALDREIQINVDMYKMQAASVTLSDIDRAIASENITISGGSVEMQGMKRSIRVTGEFKNMDVIKNIVIKSSSGALTYLKDIAEVRDGFKEKESYASLDRKNVITLNIVKKSGQNLLEASDKIKTILDNMKKDKLPSKLNITITGDQSVHTRTTLADLNNTIIIGFILVTIVLMFFMGLTNALFVGLSVPLSMALAYIVMPGIGFTMNMLVMFAFIFALGIVVDDAIVVIENTHRLFKKHKGKMDIQQAAKFAAGEVFVPILSGTLTTLAPFFPLAFWPGIIGKFMYFIPVTLIITLFASLVVAYIFNPVFAVSFMKHDDDEEHHFTAKKIWTIGGVFAGIGVLFHLMSLPGIANFSIFIGIIFVLHQFYGRKVLYRFQHTFIPALMRRYELLVRSILKGKRPYHLLWMLIGLFFVTIIITGIAKPKVVFFPSSDPNFIYAYIKMPVGTDIAKTDSITSIVENRVFSVIGDHNPAVESIISNVAVNASESTFDNKSSATNLGKVTVAFVEYAKRQGINSSIYLDKIREAVKGIAGVEITVAQNQNGPPTGKPINIEVSGEDINDLATAAKGFKEFVNSLKIPGIEELKTDFDEGKPELIIDIDRERANHEGISTGQIGMEIRNAILGKEISKYREGEDQYPIQLRYQEDQRKNIDRILDLKITYRDMNTGLLRQIPLSSIAKLKYENAYGGIKRKNLKRVITVSSNVLKDYNANEIVMKINAELPKFKMKEGIEINLTGEQEDQKETMSFLSKAMLLAMFLIMFIMITQFNSISKPIIIFSEVIFSIIGVLLGFIIFNMPISIIMTGMGVVALAGIVVRNGILLVEFTDVLKEQGMKTREAIIQAGKTRITPVILTASATILGLVPLAIGFNIDFVSLFVSLQPHIHFGGDNVAFFGALAWTIIFGLSFATFLTLLFIPAMYLITYTMKVKMQRRKSNRKARKML
ncbi:MAG: efflux RND transporter permease subunit [Bacteroidetes bacterium]|nr:efflux RND transporter permease subunit [Bacteroidota bacterium]